MSGHSTSSAGSDSRGAAAAPAAARRIVASPAAERRRRDAAQFLKTAGSAGALVLAPTRGAAEDFLRDCCREGAGLLGVHAMTPLEAAAVLAAELGPQRKLAPLSGLGGEALAARAAFECRKRGELRYFHPVADTPGFPRALAAVLGELRLEGVAAERLRPDRKSTRLNSSHSRASRMPSSA